MSSKPDLTSDFQEYVQKDCISIDDEKRLKWARRKSKYSPTNTEPKRIGDSLPAVDIRTKSSTFPLTAEREVLNGNVKVAEWLNPFRKKKQSFSRSQSMDSGLTVSIISHPFLRLLLDLRKIKFAKDSFTPKFCTINMDI